MFSGHPFRTSFHYIIHLNQNSGCKYKILFEYKIIQVVLRASREIKNENPYRITRRLCALQKQTLDISCSWLLLLEISFSFQFFSSLLSFSRLFSFLLNSSQLLLMFLCASQLFSFILSYSQLFSALLVSSLFSCSQALPSFKQQRTEKNMFFKGSPPRNIMLVEFLIYRLEIRSFIYFQTYTNFRSG